MGRTQAQTEQILDKIPPSQRAGVDGHSAAAKVKDYLVDKDASHVIPYSKGGSSHSHNIKWESKATNRARGNQLMTRQEQMRLGTKVDFDNFTGALQTGLGAVPKGAVIGIVTTVPFSTLRNTLRGARGEISPQKATLEIFKESAIGMGVCATTAFAVTTVAVAFPPVATALTAISPALLVAGGVGMVYELFKIIYELFKIVDDHRQQTEVYYESLTQRELESLVDTENEVLYEYTKNVKFLDKAQALHDEIANRPRI